MTVVPASLVGTVAETETSTGLFRDHYVLVDIEPSSAQTVNPGQSRPSAGLP